MRLFLPTLLYIRSKFLGYFQYNHHILIFIFLFILFPSKDEESKEDVEDEEQEQDAAELMVLGEQPDAHHLEVCGGYVDTK